MNYTLVSCVESRIIDCTKFYARFVLGPYAEGQALTVANTLRRSLLSQIPGVAIIFVQIQAVSHEYETVPGLKECVLDLLLKLKEIRLTSDFVKFSPEVAFLKITGPCTVRARDLKLPFFIYCVDPDQYITTLSENGQLNIKLMIGCGKGHVTHTPDSPDYKQNIELLNATPFEFTETKNSRSKFSAVYKSWKQKQPLDSKPVYDWRTLPQLRDRMAYSPVFSPTLSRGPGAFNWSSSDVGGSDADFGDVFHQIVETELGKQPKYKSSFDSSIVDQLQEEPVNPNVAKKENTKAYTLKKQKPYGNFPLDNVFSPVTKVNYSIQATGLDHPGEKIYLEIWTNGSIDPKDAVHHAVQHAIQLFLPLQKPSTKKTNLSSPFLLPPTFKGTTRRPLKQQYHDQTRPFSLSNMSESEKRIQKKAKLQYLAQVTQQSQLLRQQLNKQSKTETGETETVENNVEIIRQQDQQSTDFVPQISKQFIDQRIVIMPKTQVQRKMQQTLFKIRKKGLKKTKQGLLNIDLMNLGLPSKLCWNLKNRGINTIDQLIVLPESELMTMPFMNRKCLQTINSQLTKRLFSIFVQQTHVRLVLSDNKRSW